MGNEKSTCSKSDMVEVTEFDMVENKTMLCAVL